MYKKITKSQMFSESTKSQGQLGRMYLTNYVREIVLLNVE